MNDIQIVASSYNFATVEEYDRIISKYVDLGIDSMRVNCTRYTYEQYVRHIDVIRQSFWRKGKAEPKIILDIPFPGQKIRLTFDGENDNVQFNRGDVFTLVSDKSAMDIQKKILYIDDINFIKNSCNNDVLTYGDGDSSFIVVAKKDNKLKIEAENDGVLKYGKSIYGKHTFFKKAKSCTEIFEFIEIVKPISVVFSFLEDINDLGIETDWFEKKEIQIVPKIETRAAVNNLDSICACGINQIMLGRGDLAITAGYENFAKLQSQAINYCFKNGINVVAATDILNSINTYSLIPDRANLTDVYYLLSYGVRQFVASSYISMDEIKISRFAEILRAINL